MEIISGLKQESLSDSLHFNAMSDGAVFVELKKLRKPS